MSPEQRTPAQSQREAAGRKTRLERALSLFTEVRRGEGRTALALVGSVFLILTAYYLIKPAREGWLAVSVIAGLSKIEIKAYSSFAQALVLVAAVAAYGRMSSRWSRRDLVAGVSIFFASNLPLFWLLQPGLLAARIPLAGVAFYLWVGVFNVFMVATFWSFAADFYSDERGRRLLPLVALGATAGGAFGSWLTGPLLSSAGVDSYDLLLVAAVPLLASVALARLADALGPMGLRHQGAGPPMRPAAEDGSGALDLVLRHRYLTATALLTVFFAWVASNGDNVLYETVQEVVGASAAHLGIEPGAALEAFVSERTTSFYGDFFLWVNLSALALQAFVTARLLRYGGFGVLLLFLPVLSVVAYSTMAILPTLAVIKLMKVAESSSNYSIHNTARHVLWLPTTAEMKYKAKSAVDTICVRVGDGLAALTVLVGVRMLSASPLRILWLNVALGVAWICVALVIAREHARLSRKEVQIAPR